MAARRDAFAAIVGGRLRAARKRERLSLEDLSRLSGIGIATLSHVENGSRDIRLSTLARILDALDMDIADLSASPSRTAPGGRDDRSAEARAKPAAPGDDIRSNDRGGYDLGDYDLGDGDPGDGDVEGVP